MSHRVVADAGEAPAGLIEASATFSSEPATARASRWRLVAALQVLEAIAAGLSASNWMGDIIAEGGGQAGRFHLVAFAVTVAVVVHFVLRSLCAYDFARILHVWRSSVTAVAAWMLATAPLLSWSISLEPAGGLWQHSLPDWLTGVAFIGLVRLAAGYLGATLVLTRRVSHNVVVIGGGAEAKTCLDLLRSDSNGACVAGFIPVQHCTESESRAEQQAVYVAIVQQLIQSHKVRDVIVATSAEDNGNLREIVRGFLCLPVRVLLWPPSIGLEPEWARSSGCKLGDTPLLVASAPPLDGWHWVLKDVQDRILAVLLLIICAPALLGIALLIRLSSAGPVLFRQEREGYNGNRFVIFKFRTMNMSPVVTDRLVLTAKGDSRIFPVGAFLRKTSLDELPQLLNVILGDMWLVGPRPHSPLATAAGQRYAAAAKQYIARFRVKPGMTGWAQVNGWRGSTDTIEQIQQRVVHDLYYIENWSVWLDLQILVQTAIKGFVHHNAY